jgi:hypothetical protein
MNCMSAGYDSATGNKTMTDAALRKAFPDARVTSGPGCRCPLGSGTNLGRSTQQQFEWA